MRGFRGFSPTVWLLGLASLFNDVSSEAIFPLLPLFLASLPGGGARVLGLVEGAAEALGAAVKVLAGRWSDRGPRRAFVIGGYGLPAAARAGIAAAVAPWQVLVARLVDRMGKGIRSGPRDALLADAAAPGERGRAFGLQRSMDHLGAAVGPLVASGLLAGGASLRVTFGVAAGMGVVAPLVLAWRLGRERDRHQDQDQDRHQDQDQDRDRQMHLQVPVQVPMRTQLRQYLLLAGVFALGNSTDAFLLLKARAVGFSESAVPLLWFGHHVVKTLAGLPGGVLSDRVPRRWVVAAGWGAYALAYAGFAVASAPWQVAVLFGGYALYHGLAEGAERALVSDLAPAGERGRAFGWYHGVTGAAALPAGLLTGWLWEARGSAVALGTCAAFAGVAALALAVSPAASGRGGVSSS